MHVQGLIDRLHGARKTGRDQWVARCPAHDDRSPSLAIRECDDGKVLVKCFGGCSVHEVIAAVGLELSDLFPTKNIAVASRPMKRPWTAATLIHLLDFESLIVLVVVCDLVSRGGAPQSALDRLALARERIAAVAGELS